MLGDLQNRDDCEDSDDEMEFESTFVKVDFFCCCSGPLRNKPQAAFLWDNPVFVILSPWYPRGCHPALGLLVLCFLISFPASAVANEGADCSLHCGASGPAPSGGRLRGRACSCGVCVCVCGGVSGFGQGWPVHLCGGEEECPFLTYKALP